MPIADLKEKILSDAKADAERMEKEAEDEANNIIAAARDFLERERELLRKEADRIAGERYQNIVTLARIQAKNRILKTKQETINKVFHKAKEKLYKMNPEDFKTFGMKLLRKFAPPAQEETILVTGRIHEKDIDSKFLEKLNKSLEGTASGKFVSGKVDKPPEDGFILITGDVRIDLSFDSILKAAREEIELEVIKILFGKG